LRHPLLYLSVYLKAHRTQYYDRLTAIRNDGDWEGWLGVFLRGVAETSNSATTTAHAIMELRESLRARSLPPAAARLRDKLFEHPVLTARAAQSLMSVQFATANREGDQRQHDPGAGQVQRHQRRHAGDERWVGLQRDDAEVRDGRAGGPDCAQRCSTATARPRATCAIRIVRTTRSRRGRGAEGDAADEEDDQAAEAEDRRGGADGLDGQQRRAVRDEGAPLRREEQRDEMADKECEDAGVNTDRRRATAAPRRAMPPAPRRTFGSADEEMLSTLRVPAKPSPILSVHYIALTSTLSESIVEP
jgi:hypothetical protein